MQEECKPQHVDSSALPKLQLIRVGCSTLEFLEFRIRVPVMSVTFITSLVLDFIILLLNKLLREFQHDYTRFVSSENFL